MPNEAKPNKEPDTKEVLHKEAPKLKQPKEFEIPPGDRLKGLYSTQKLMKSEFE